MNAPADSARTVVVTGAAMGIGAAIARGFAGPGQRLLLLDREADALACLAQECRERGADVTILVVDFAGDAWLAQLRPMLQSLGGIDVLVNNAGIAPENEPDDDATWRQVMTINLDAPVQLTAACLERMGGGARIINIASVLGRVGKVRNTAYCASKHGLLGYTKALALDLAARGITVNAVLPGWVDTPMLRRELATQAQHLGSAPEQVLRNARRQVPLKRFVREEEVAAMVTYLATAAAAGVTAQGFVVDGGATCGM
ncbi:SDR family NAD(P)-dependent oxidoreductase [Montanilutibacter psychrotolerans]|uniref:SDR family oxidoreductase n=1 Tax=Montanilutibacter psychrotolerans TaxID=1327343 RepID=A0A3M8SVN8_9GAMM|nr:SDR family oxidoreductase [Lysobacter psychrotolerans]RNF85407.1 SDR family oxidoreductase [Lysobacter psychrotolerans]